MKSVVLIFLFLLAVAVTAAPLPPLSSRMLYKLTWGEYKELKQRMRSEGRNFSCWNYIKWLRRSRHKNHHSRSQRSKPSKPSKPSMPSTPSMPNKPTMPSKPSMPSMPSSPSTPSAPTEPSMPTEPSTPSSPGSPTEPQQPSELSTEAPASGMAAEILAVHNKERKLVGVAPLAWSAALQRTAQQWANTIANEGDLRHSTNEFPGTGENLWKGWGRRYSYSEMVQAWADEKKDFVYGTFPNVNPNGGIVGHYTQMIWRATTQVGCATAGQQSSGVVLVCHYKKQGNFYGQKVY